MSVDIIDLYATASLTHTGTVDSGTGVGLRVPSPGLSQWQAYGTIPTGIVKAFSDYWTHGAYLYGCYDGTDGTGRGVYRYAIAADGTLTYDTYVTMATLGLTGQWGECGCAQYDPVSGCVILVSLPVSGSGNVFCRKWDCANWPFSNANKEWTSTITQRYGTYGATEFHGRGTLYWDVANDRLFLASLNAGQVVTIDTTDGSTAGNWIYSGAWSGTYPFIFLGVDLSGKPIGGSNHASGGNKNVYLWDITNLSSWATDTLLFTDAQTTIGTSHYKRAARSLYAYRALAIPLGPAEHTLLGFSSNELAFWWPSADPQYQYGEPRLMVYNASTGAFSDRPLTVSSIRRATGNFNFYPFGYRFIQAGGIPWFISPSYFTQDIEADNPGGTGTQQLGLVLMPVGPGTCKYTWTAATAITPYYFMFAVDRTAKNYLHSEHLSKHRVRMRIDGGAWTDWRAGAQEILNLQYTVNGKAAWATASAGATVEVEHGMCSGWPYVWDELIYNNPGEAGDPTAEPVSTPEVGPPREARAFLGYAGTAVVHTLVGIAADVVIDPPTLAVEVELDT